jgi:hypothetical protein
MTTAKYVLVTGAGENINIKDSIQLAFNQFINFLAKAPKAPAA